MLTDDPVESSLGFCLESEALNLEEKRNMFKHISSNYGKTALCLSGGACFSYVHPFPWSYNLLMPVDTTTLAW